MIKYGYKVVSSHGKIFKSAMWGETFPNMVLYTLNQYSTRISKKFGPLAVFTNKIDAKNFINQYKARRDLKLFKCNYIQSQERQLYKKLSLGEILKCENLPLGTDFADQVMITEEIKTNE